MLGTAIAAAGPLPHTHIRHDGATDPKTESWSRNESRKGTIAEERIESDPVGGLPAWSIDDDGTPQAPARLSYEFPLPPRDAYHATTRRWRYSMSLRVVEASRTPSFSICGEVATATTRYMIRFGADGKGNTVVTLGLKGPILTATVPGTGYHRFVMDFDPEAGDGGRVSVFADDAKTPLVADYPGEPGKGVGPRLVWGSNESASAGHGHYHAVRFSMDVPPAKKLPLPPSRVAVDNVCAWPNLTVLPDGTIAAVIYSLPSHGGGEGDAQCWASEDEGQTWKLRGIPAPHDSGTCRMNVAAGLARNGDLVVLCSGWDKRDMKAPRHRRIAKAFVSRSSDGGKTWRISREFPAEKEMSEFIPFGDIIQGQDGALYVSAYAQTPGNKGYTYHSYLLRSDDDGHTWRRVGVIARGHNETAIIQLADGTWLAAARAGHMDLYVSRDNGATWRIITSTSANQHPGHFLLLKDGRVLLSHGERRAGIEGVGVRVSTDAAKTWPPVSLPIARALNFDCGYPSSVQLRDGRIMTAYYAKGTPTHPKTYHMAVVFWNVDALLKTLDKP